MNITEVSVNLTDDKNDRLKAFCSITIDGEFVVRDIKIIEGRGGYFMAMPSKKMSDCCKNCGGKNHLRAKYCNNCGKALASSRIKKDFKGKMRLHADVAHPINIKCRREIQNRIVAAFKEEVEKSKQPGYRPVELDIPEEDVPQIV